MSHWNGLTPPYSTIVADPPWHYDNYATNKGRASGWKSDKRVLPYGTMSVTEICELPVSELAASNCWLFLWTTNAYLQRSFEVVGAWGFTYRQMLVWHKTVNPSPLGGSVAPNHAEFLVVAGRGSPTCKERLPGSVVAAPRQFRHSRKPGAFLDAVESIAVGPYVELFARQPRLGWDSWGYGYEQAASRSTPT